MITAPTLTNAGKELLTRSVGGEKITFTRFAVGNGDQPGEIAEMTAVVNPILYFPISSCENANPGYVKVNGRFTSNDIESDFRWKELGLLCKGEDGVEMLYAYSNDGENGTWLKAKGADVTAENAVSIVIAIGDAKNVTAITVDSAVFATKKEVDTHVADKSNPHIVTAAQVGLGNVPNVATNDQTPTYDTPNAVETLKSGEKLSISFGKIRAAITALIEHLRAKNPHGITADKIDAAAKKHTHSAVDVTSGILGVARGGTGVGNLADLAYAISDSHIVTGTYPGSGKYGASNPTTLTFNRPPKLLIVQAKKSRSASYGGFVVIRGTTEIFNGGFPDDVERGHLYFSWNGNTVSWYDNSSAAYQQNYSDNGVGDIYNYIAVL